MQLSELFPPPPEDINEDEHSRLLNQEIRSSSESLPPGRQLFGQLRVSLNTSEEAKIIQTFLCDVFVYILLIWVLISFSSGAPKCGIPVAMWNIVYISLFMFNSIIKLMQIVIIRYCIQFRARYTLITMVIFNFTVVGWLIYGNVIYFSDENDCRQI